MTEQAQPTSAPDNGQQADPAPEAAATATPEATPEAKPSDTVEFWKQKARENEKRAKANAEKATEFEKWQESQKTEQQRQADAYAKAQQEAATARAEALQYKAAATHNVSPDYFDMLGAGTEDEVLGRAEKLGGLLKAQARVTELEAELDALRKGRPQSAPVANLRPGATPEQVVADDFAYPASWTNHQN